MGNDDFGDEDTEPGDAPPLLRGGDAPSYELLWVEEPGLGMVLRVRQVAATRRGAPVAAE